MVLSWASLFVGCMVVCALLFAPAFLKEWGANRPIGRFFVYWILASGFTFLIFYLLGVFEERLR